MELDFLATHLGDVDEAVLVDSDVNKCTESGHVRDDSRQFHTRLEVIYLVDVLGETELLGTLAWVTARFRQFLKNIINRRKTELTLYLG